MRKLYLVVAGQLGAVGEFEAADAGKRVEPRPGAADVVPIVGRHDLGDGRHVIIDILAPGAGRHREIHHAFVMAGVDGRVLDLFHEHVLDHVPAGLEIGAVGDDVAEPARKPVGEIAVFERKHPPARGRRIAWI